MRRVFSWVLVALVAALGVGWVGLRDPDLEPSILKERYTSIASQFLTLASGAVAHVRDQGPREAPVLVLLHGSNASLHTWEPWVEILSPELRVVSMDLPGHGLTGRVYGDNYRARDMAVFVGEVATRLDIERMSVAGNSMGGRVAWNFAVAYPDRVEALILLAASGYPDDRPSPLAYRMARMPGLRSLMRSITPRGLIEATLKDAIADDDLVTGAMVTRYHELLRRKGSREASGIRLNLPPDASRVEKVKRITAPTLILWGSEDTFVPVAHARHFHRDIEGSVLRIYPGIGHMPMEEIPSESAADVRAFLRREPAAEPS